MFLRVLLLASLAASKAFASVSFQGTFATDDQLELFQFSIGATQTVTIVSWEYGGGTNAANTVIPAGGFDTLFTLFDGTGAQIGSFDDCGAGSGQSSNHDACLDAYYQDTLTSGSYFLALTQSGNDSNGDLIDGFSQQGQGNFTCAPFSLSGAFCDTFGNQDNGNWAVDFVNVDSAVDITGVVPEPASFLLTGGAAALLLAFTRRRQAHRRESFAGVKK
jgi:hypothetical protein